MGLAQQLRQEGLSQGEALILSRLLKLRFGPLPAWVEQQLQQAPPERLEALADRLLDADSLDAVFRA